MTVRDSNEHPHRILVTLCLTVLAALEVGCTTSVPGANEAGACTSSECDEPDAAAEGGVIGRPSRPIGNVDSDGLDGGADATATDGSTEADAEGKPSGDAEAVPADAGGCDGCTDLRALEIAFGVLEPAFSPSVRAYEVHPSLFQTVVEITPTAQSGVGLRVDGAAHPSALAFLVEVGTGREEVRILSGSGADTVTYTLTIVPGDPHEAKLQPSGLDHLDAFGTSVALSADGRTLAVGAIRESSSGTGVDGVRNDDMPEAGAVFLFARTNQGWDLTTYIKAFAPSAGDRFGQHVALSGDGNVLAVGTSLEDSTSLGIDSTPNDAGEDVGAVYTYRRVDGQWTTDAYFKPDDAADREFGMDVSLSDDGSVMAVGVAAGTDPLGRVTGSVYLYTYDAGRWQAGPVLLSSNGYNGQRVGTSVSLSADGRVVAAGAPRDHSSTTGINSEANNLAPSAGAVFVFENSDAAGWQEAAYVKAGNAGASDAFGASVSLDATGTRLAVGALWEDSTEVDDTGAASGTTENSGAVYLFDRTAQGWSPGPMLKAPDAETLYGFGSSVSLAVDGRMLAVGASSYPALLAGVFQLGKAYVLSEAEGQWQFETRPSPSDNARYFAQQIALSRDGSSLAVSAEDDRVQGSTVSLGSVYTYTP